MAPQNPIPYGPNAPPMVPTPPLGSPPAAKSSLQTFITDVNPLRPTHYKIWINASPPLGIGELFAETVTLPGRQLATLPRTFAGAAREIPYQRIYSGDLDVTFVWERLGSSQSQFREGIEKWMDYIISPTNNRMNIDYFTYTGDMTIELEDPKTGNGVFKMKLNEVFPKTINPTPLGYGMNDDYLRLSVSFAFRDYIIEEPAKEEGNGENSQGNNYEI